MLILKLQGSVQRSISNCPELDTFAKVKRELLSRYCEEEDEVTIETFPYALRSQERRKNDEPSVNKAPIENSAEEKEDKLSQERDEGKAATQAATVIGYPGDNENEAPEEETSEEEAGEKEALEEDAAKKRDS